MRISHILSLCFLVLALAACSSASRDNYDQMLQSWMGKDSDELVEIWGPPDSVYEQRDRSRILTYFSRRIVPYPGSPMFGASNYGVFGGYSYPGYTETRICKTSFLVNRNRAIVNYQFHGDNCYASLETKQRYDAPDAAEPLPWQQPNRTPQYR